MENFNDSLLQAILVTLIQVLAPVVLAAAVAYIKVLIDRTKAQIPGEQLAFATELARQLVLAAEQNGLTDELLKEGIARKEWVILRLESELEKRGIHLDLHMLSDLIEGMVYDQLNRGKAQ